MAKSPVPMMHSDDINSLPKHCSTEEAFRTRNTLAFTSGRVPGSVRSRCKSETGLIEEALRLIAPFRHRKFSKVTTKTYYDLMSSNSANHYAQMSLKS